MATKKTKSNAKFKKVETGDNEEDEGSMRGTAGAASRNPRDAVREEVMTQEEGRTALSLALMEQREDIADLIISIDDTDVNAPDVIAGWTCLFYATYHNEANIVQYLLMHGADPDQKDHRGMTAVDWGEHMGFGETCAIFCSFESQLAP
eukprot:g9814.t1